VNIVKLRYNSDGARCGAPWVVEDGPMVVHAAGYALTGRLIASLSKEQTELLKNMKFTGLELRLEWVEVDVSDIQGRPFVTFDLPRLTAGQLH
jgi:hypothetical protein